MHPMEGPTVSPQKGSTVGSLEEQVIAEQNTIYNKEASKSDYFNYIDSNLFKNLNVEINPLELNGFLSYFKYNSNN